MSNDFAPDYEDVSQRITKLFEKYPDASLRGTYEILTIGDQTFVCYTAECWRSEGDNAPGVGTAWELVPGRTPFTRGSEMQNAETSAWGRAIRAVGVAQSKHVASAEEVRNRATEEPAQPSIPAGFDSVDEAKARQAEVAELAKTNGVTEWVKEQKFDWPWSAEVCDKIAAAALAGEPF